ncbi:MAG: hypothetical protein SGPRY_004368 [Prymnesium sp.]
MRHADLSPFARLCSPRCCAPAPASTTPWSDLAENALRLSDAQLTRTVMSVCTEGTLCSKFETAEVGGSVFASCEPFITDKAGGVLLSLSSQQTKDNLGALSRASFFVRAPMGGTAPGSSVTLIGEVEEMSVDDVTDADVSEAAHTFNLHPLHPTLCE